MPALGVPDGSGGHHCWIFDEPAEFHSQVRAFLSEGMRRNERVLYVGEDCEADLRAQMAAIGFDAAIDRGSAGVAVISQAYGGSAPLQAQVDAFVAAVAAALGDGYAGLRVAADATSLAALPAWNHYEHLVDRFMVGRPLTGLCGFDVRRLDAQTVAELECLHPVTNTAAVGFRVTACSPAADRLALSGELDFTNHPLLVRALRAADLQPAAGRVVIDMHGLRFADHRTILLLRDYAAARGATLTLLDPRPGARHIVEALGCAGIQIARSR